MLCCFALIETNAELVPRACIWMKDYNTFAREARVIHSTQASVRRIWRNVKADRFKKW